jgi:hypothetical protein
MIAELGNDSLPIHALIKVFGESAYKELIHGFTFDSTSKVWGGDGKYRGVPSEKNRIRLRLENVSKYTPVDKTKGEFVEPLGPGVLRTLSEHRETIDNYASAYANGFDPLTGEDLSEHELETAQSKSDYVAPAYAKGRKKNKKGIDSLIKKIKGD